MKDVHIAQEQPIILSFLYSTRNKQLSSDELQVSAEVSSTVVGVIRKQIKVEGSF